MLSISKILFIFQNQKIIKSLRKADIKEIMKITATTRVGAPVRIGQVVFSFKGVDFIATRSVEKADKK